MTLRPSVTTMPPLVIVRPPVVTIKLKWWLRGRGEIGGGRGEG